MSIQEISSDIKRFLTETDILIFSLILVVGSLSFLLGRLSVGELSVSNGLQEAATILVPDNESIPIASTTVKMSGQPEMSAKTATIAEGYVASRNGTKYHLPWCPGALRIKDENKVWFKTKAEAEAAGYTPALNCKGI